MTAPRTLPDCPVCGNEPFWIPPMVSPSGAITIDGSLYCRSRQGGRTTHELTVYGATLADADARWRRLAGAGGEGK